MGSSDPALSCLPVAPVPDGESPYRGQQTDRQEVGLRRNSRGQRSACNPSRAGGNTAISLTTRGPSVQMCNSHQKVETPPAGDGEPHLPQGLARSQLRLSLPGARCGQAVRDPQVQHSNKDQRRPRKSHGQGGLRPVSCTSTLEAFSFGLVAGNFSCWLQPRSVWTRAPFQGETAWRKGL